MCIYIYTYTHIYTYIYIYTYHVMQDMYHPAEVGAHFPTSIDSGILEGGGSKGEGFLEHLGDLGGTLGSRKLPSPTSTSSFRIPCLSF